LQPPHQKDRQCGAGAKLPKIPAMLTQARRQRVIITIRSNRCQRAAGIVWRRVRRSGFRELRLARNHTTLLPTPMRPRAAAVAVEA